MPLLYSQLLVSDILSPLFLMSIFLLLAFRSILNFLSIVCWKAMMNVLGMLTQKFPILICIISILIKTYHVSGI